VTQEVELLAVLVMTNSPRRWCQQCTTSLLLSKGYAHQASTTESDICTARPQTAWKMSLMDTAERTVLRQTQISSMAALKLNDHRRIAQPGFVDQVECQNPKHAAV